MTYRLQLRAFTPFFCAALFAPAVTSDAAAAAPTPVTISYSEKTVDFLPLLMASDAGYFKQHGLDATVQYLPAQEGIPALITSQVQIGGIGGTDVASAEAQGTKLKLVLTLTPIDTFQFWARPQYPNAAALKGQRVGITSTTGSLYAGTLLALKELGLTTSDVALTPLGGVVNVNSSLLAGSIAAAASHPPPTYQFAHAGFVDLVDLAKKKIPSVSAGVWVAQSYLDEHRDVVQNVVDAVVEAMQREKSDPAFAETEMRKHLGVDDKAEFQFTYDFYLNEVLSPQPMPEEAQIEANIQALAASNPAVKSVDASTMFDQSFVKNAEKQQASDAHAATKSDNAPK